MAIIKYIKRFKSELEDDYIIEEVRDDLNYNRVVSESNPNFLEFINSGGNLEIINFTLEENNAIKLEEESKTSTRMRIESMFYDRINSPLETVYGFSVKQTKDDIDLWRSGIIPIILYNKESLPDNKKLTPEEEGNLLAGTLTGSIIEKVKDLPAQCIDYYGNIKNITVGQMQNIVWSQVSAFQVNLFTKNKLIAASETMSIEERKYLTWDYFNEV